MFKDHFKAWNISKKLQPEEVEALLRVKAYRTAVGDSVHLQFSRYGKPIRLERYLRDHPRLHKKLRQNPSDESMVDDLVERYLPSRGLVVLESPQRYLRGEEGLHLTEAAMYSLKSFRATNSSWDISGCSLSIAWIRTATWEHHNEAIMAELQVDRDAAWCKIELAYQLLQTDMESHPGSFALDLLSLFAVIMDEGQVPRLVCQLAQYISSLSEVVLGVQSAYHNLFTALLRLVQDSSSTGTLSFKDFHTRISEFLIDIIIARIRAGSADGTYSKTLSLMHKVVAPSKRGRIKATLQLATTTADSNESFVRVAVVLARMHLRDGDYLAAHALNQTIRGRCDGTSDVPSGVFEPLRWAAILGRWDYFDMLAGFMEVGVDFGRRELLPAPKTF